MALGVDGAAEDGVFAFGEDDFRRLGAAIAGAGLPTVLVQEGGYDLDVLGRNVVAVLDGFEQQRLSPFGAELPTSRRATGRSSAGRDRWA